MYRNNRSFEWFYEAQNKGVYNKNFTLKDYAHEIEWRLKYQDMITKERRGSMFAEWELFLMSLNNPQHRIISNDSFASEIRNPIRMPEVKSSTYDKTEYYIKGSMNQKQGLLLPFYVNFSYDDQTLISEFENKLRKLRARINGTNLTSAISKSERGHIALTEKDAINWNERHILECIDFRLWQKMTGGYDEGYLKSNNSFARDLDIKESTLEQTNLKKSRKIFSDLSLGLIKASLRGAEG